MVVEQVPIDQATDAATDFAADGHATDAAEERACDGSKGGAGRPGHKADGQADTGALQRSRDTTGAASDGADGTTGFAADVSGLDVKRPASRACECGQDDAFRLDGRKWVVEKVMAESTGIWF